MMGVQFRYDDEWRVSASERDYVIWMRMCLAHQFESFVNRSIDHFRQTYKCWSPFGCTMQIFTCFQMFTCISVCTSSDDGCWKLSANTHTYRWLVVSSCDRQSAAVCVDFNKKQSQQRKKERNNHTGAMQRTIERTNIKVLSLLHRCVLNAVSKHTLKNISPRSERQRSWKIVCRHLRFWVCMIVCRCLCMCQHTPPYIQFHIHADKWLAAYWLVSHNVNCFARITLNITLTYSICECGNGGGGDDGGRSNTNESCCCCCCRRGRRRRRCDTIFL